MHILNFFLASFVKFSFYNFQSQTILYSIILKITKKQNASIEIKTLELWLSGSYSFEGV